MGTKFINFCTTRGKFVIINLENIAKTIWLKEINNQNYSQISWGTDSHTTMVNSLSVLGWGLEDKAEAAMLGQQFP